MILECGVETFQYPVYVYTLKNISVRPPPVPNTTVVCATSYHSTHSYLAY